MLSARPAHRTTRTCLVQGLRIKRECPGGFSTKEFQHSTSLHQISSQPYTASHLSLPLGWYNARCNSRYDAPRLHQGGLCILGPRPACWCWSARVPVLVPVVALAYSALIHSALIHSTLNHSTPIHLESSFVCNQRAISPHKDHNWQH